MAQDIIISDKVAATVRIEIFVTWADTAEIHKLTSVHKILLAEADKAAIVMDKGITQWKQAQEDRSYQRWKCDDYF